MHWLKMLLILPIIACSDDKNPTASVPTLDTTPKTQTGSYFTIREWDGDNWVDTVSRVTLEVTWRFISYSGDTENDTGGTLTGGYSINFTSDLSDIVDGRIASVKLVDELGIVIGEASIGDNFTIQPNSSNTRSGTFSIFIPELAVSELISELSVFGGFTRDR